MADVLNTTLRDVKIEYRSWFRGDDPCALRTLDVKFDIDLPGLGWFAVSSKYDKSNSKTYLVFG